MIWVGSFNSLRSALHKRRFLNTPLKVHTWVPSEIGLISPLADWLTSLIAASRCVLGAEEFVELALREALSNAVLHGNRSDASKLVHIRCCCESTTGVCIVVRDQGNGFDPNKVPDPLAVENLDSEHGRGIHLMKLAMDEISFERQGTEVRMRKASVARQEIPVCNPHDRIARRLVARPSPGVRVLNCVSAPLETSPTDLINRA